MQKDVELLLQLENCVKNTSSARSLFKLAKCFNEYIVFLDFALFGDYIKSFNSTYYKKEKELFISSIGKPYKINFWVFLFSKI